MTNHEVRSDDNPDRISRVHTVHNHTVLDATRSGATYRGVGVSDSDTVDGCSRASPYRDKCGRIFLFPRRLAGPLDLRASVGSCAEVCVEKSVPLNSVLDSRPGYDTIWTLQYLVPQK